MPLRGDFDVEWDNDAELLLADMEWGEVRAAAVQGAEGAEGAEG